MTYKEHDIVRFKYYDEVYVGKIIYLKEVLGEEFYIAATQYRTYTISINQIIEKL
jgi:hypothetical protein